MPEFVEAVNANGEKQTIPADWLDHPVLGQGFRLPPSVKSEGKAAASAAASTKTPAAGDKE